MLSAETRTGPLTGLFQMDVVTVAPFHFTSRGSPALTDTIFIAMTSS
jgi:hypothetical protein